jgi:hypothetical protein
VLGEAPPREAAGSHNSLTIYVNRSGELGLYGTFEVYNWGRPGDGGDVHVKLTGLTYAEAEAVARVVARKEAA